MITGQNLSLYLGDSFSQDLTAYSTATEYFNLSGWTGEAGVKYRYGNTGYALQFNFEAISEVSGLFNISCNSIDTTGLAPGENHYNVILSSGQSRETVYYGYLNTYPSVVFH